MTTKKCTKSHLLSKLKNKEKASEQQQFKGPWLEIQLMFTSLTELSQMCADKQRLCRQAWYLLGVHKLLSRKT